MTSGTSTLEGPAHAEPPRTWTLGRLFGIGYKVAAVAALAHTIFWGFVSDVPRLPVLNETIRNLYYHVPMWIAMLAMAGASMVFSIQYLRTEKAIHDIRAEATARVATLFGIIGITTGAVWANYTWGEPWSNDAKQISTAVALLIYLAYLVLRGSFSNARQGARFAAVYNVLAFALLVPLLYIVPKIEDSLHPGAEGSPAFSKYTDDTMRGVLYIGFGGWILFGAWISELVIRVRRLENRDKAVTTAHPLQTTT